MTNLRPDASRGGVQQTAVLIALVALTALALLLGHPLERLHDAAPSGPAATVAATLGDADAAAAGVPALSDSLGGIAELCALLAVVCAAVVIARALAARARPGRGSVASTAPPAPAARLAATDALRAGLDLSSSSVPLRL